MPSKAEKVGLTGGVAYTYILKIKFRRFGTPFSLEPKHVKSHVSAVPIAEYIWAVHTNTPPLAKHCTAAQA